MTSQKDKKNSEKRLLVQARKACAYFPNGMIFEREEPDFEIRKDGFFLGVEVTELQRPKGESRFTPVEEESFHQEVISLAEKCYFEANGMPISVQLSFLSEEICRNRYTTEWRERSKGNEFKLSLARDIAEFIIRQKVSGAEIISFNQLSTLPKGIGVIGLSPPGHGWLCNEHGNLKPLEYSHLNSIIKKKNNLLTRYRINFPLHPIWLLVVSGVSVPRGVPIPKALEEWSFSFDFDRVLLFSAMDNAVFDVKHLDSRAG